MKHEDLVRDVGKYLNNKLEQLDSIVVLSGGHFVITFSEGLVATLLHPITSTDCQLRNGGREGERERREGEERGRGERERREGRGRGERERKEGKGVREHKQILVAC